jgi:hypothetical protein
MKPALNDLLVVEFDTSRHTEGSEDTVLEESDDESESGVRPQRSASVQLPSVFIGRLMGWDNSGHPLVDYPQNSTGGLLPARMLVPLDQTAVGSEVALTFIEGDLGQPLVIGLIQPPRQAPSSETPQVPAAEVDGDRLVFTAEKEIVLRCGNASITLTRAGKVLIRGAYLLSRSSGVNRIKGGSVQIN